VCSYDLLWNLPVVYVIENNRYGIGTSVKRASSNQELFSRGEAFGIPGFSVDGMDVLAVKEAGEKALKYARSGKGPYILGMQTYRYRGHSMSDPAKYRTREEVQKMREERDAIENIRSILLTGNHASEDDLKSIDKEIKKIVNESAEFAKASPEPELEELYTDIYA
jgi:pyruvate dehydrogenase E1 component alpha subunit